MLDELSKNNLERVHALKRRYETVYKPLLSPESFNQMDTATFVNHIGDIARFTGFVEIIVPVLFTIIDELYAELDRKQAAE